MELSSGDRASFFTEMTDRLGSRAYRFEGLNVIIIRDLSVLEIFEFQLFSKAEYALAEIKSSVLLQEDPSGIEMFSSHKRGDRLLSSSTTPDPFGGKLCKAFMPSVRKWKMVVVLTTNQIFYISLRCKNTATIFEGQKIVCAVHKKDKPISVSYRHLQYPIHQFIKGAIKVPSTERY
jgi:hypothetical protein